MLKFKPFLGYYRFWVILTYLSVVCAISAMAFAFFGNFNAALALLLGSGLCDAFDGKVARLAKRDERARNFGIQIDSLCDTICFGATPIVIGFCLIKPFSNGAKFVDFVYVAVFALYALGLVIRLAWFNVIEMELKAKGEHRKFYEGVPVTNAGFWIPFVMAICAVAKASSQAISITYICLIAVFAVGFVSRIKIPKPNTKTFIICASIALPVVILIFVGLFVGMRI